jgi:hypothetical protein
MPSRAIKFGALALVVLALGATCAQAIITQKGNAIITQKGNLRVKVSGTISPNTLPRTGAAPIAVSVAGQVSTVDQSFPPQLKVLKIEINRNGRLDYQGLPLCAAHEIQPATNERALSACRAALVGQGTFNAYIVLKGQEPYPASGRLLLFNGREGGRQVLLGHIYISQPFASSFLIPFQIAANPHGQYGTTLTADLAKALGARRYLTGIDMTLQRRYSSHGARHSFISAGCPAPKGFPGASFPLARTSFSFAGGAKLSSTLTSNCKARG